MSENSKKTKSQDGPSPVQGIITTYKAEFKKIVWPSRQTLIKHTLTVVVVSLIFGAYIAVTDGIFGALFSRFVSIIG